MAYATPAILRQVAFVCDESVLAGSIVDTLDVTSTGQELEDKNFETDGFTHTWN